MVVFGLLLRQDRSHSDCRDGTSGQTARQDGQNSYGTITVTRSHSFHVCQPSTTYEKSRLRQTQARVKAMVLWPCQIPICALEPSVRFASDSPLFCFISAALRNIRYADDAAGCIMELNRECDSSDRVAVPVGHLVGPRRYITHMSPQRVLGVARRIAVGRVTVRSARCPGAGSGDGRGSERGEILGRTFSRSPGPGPSGSSLRPSGTGPVPCLLQRPAPPGGRCPGRSRSTRRRTDLGTRCPPVAAPSRRPRL